MKKGKKGKRSEAEFACQECGRKFWSVKAAERASLNGCPKCGGLDIDLNVRIDGREGQILSLGW